MIPVFVKDAWLRSRMIELDDHDAGADQPTSGDPVVRAALATMAVIMVIAALSVTKSIAAPVFAGVVFGLVFGPLVDRLAKIGLPTGLAAGLVVLASFVCLVLLVGMFSAPFAIWSDRLPEIVAALKQRATDVLTMLKPVAALGESLTGPDASPSQVVTLEQGAPWFTIATTSTAVASGLLIAFATMYFYLATRRQLKARALRLCLGKDARRHAGHFLADIEDKIAGYFGIVTIINLGMGAITALIAWTFGLPFALFWGLLAFVLNYVAFIGPFIVTGLLVGAGLVDNVPLLVALTPALAYFLVHLIEGNLVTPVAIGRRLTVNPFLVFLSFVFWLWLWGPLGAILATPILLIATIASDSWRAWRAAITEETGADNVVADPSELPVPETPIAHRPA
jgi:predicted PurR-regulated permease PerM